MKLSKMTKEDLELLSHKDITYYLLEEGKMNTAELFKKVVELLELPKKTFEEKIGDYYTLLTTDKRFILLEDGTWDLRNRHTSDKIVKVTEDDEDDDIDEEMKDDNNLSNDEDNYDSSDDDTDDYDDTNEDLKDLVIVDEDELEEES